MVSLVRGSCAWLTRFRHSMGSICADVCICFCIRICIHVYLHIPIYIPKFRYLSRHTCAYKYIYIYVHIDMYVCVVCGCMYNIHIYTHTQTHVRYMSARPPKKGPAPPRLGALPLGRSGDVHFNAAQARGLQPSHGM